MYLIFDHLCSKALITIRHIEQLSRRYAITLVEYRIIQIYFNFLLRAVRILRFLFLRARGSFERNQGDEKNTQNEDMNINILGIWRRQYFLQTIKNIFMIYLFYDLRIGIITDI